MQCQYLTQIAARIIQYAFDSTYFSQEAKLFTMKIFLREIYILGFLDLFTCSCYLKLQIYFWVLLVRVADDCKIVSKNEQKLPPEVFYKKCALKNFAKLSG